MTTISLLDPMIEPSKYGMCILGNAYKASINIKPLFSPYHGALAANTSPPDWPMEPSNYGTFILENVGAPPENATP